MKSATSSGNSFALAAVCLSALMLGLEITSIPSILPTLEHVLPADFRQPLATPVPALVLEGEFDPVTPPRYGEQVVKTLPNGRLFVLKGLGHSVLSAGCLPKLFTQFIEKADAKRLDGKCLDSLAYPVPFTSFNGSEP